MSEKEKAIENFLEITSELATLRRKFYNVLDDSKGCLDESTHSALGVRLNDMEYLENDIEAILL